MYLLISSHLRKEMKKKSDRYFKDHTKSTIFISKGYNETYPLNCFLLDNDSL